MDNITYVIAVGIEEYHEGALANVKFAKKDAADFINALLGLGYDKNDCILLNNERATKTTILNTLVKTIAKASELDRIFFYFAGHGFSVNGNNMLAPVDTAFDSIENTCISISEIITLLQKSSSKRNILFLDSCHSGFQKLDNIRDGSGSFNADNLEYEFKDIEYCVGFASCQSNQKSYSDTAIQNGVWSYFLIKAMKGLVEDDLYEDGYLMSDKLQRFLRLSTQEYVKTNIRKDQVPIEFGNKTDKFIVVNLNPLFEAIETSKKASTINLTSISIYNLQDGKVRNLKGFTKTYHSIPSKISNYEDKFIKSISNDIIDAEIGKLSVEIQKKLNYKRKDIIVYKENGLGSIETPDFYYSIIVSQSQTFPEQYEVRKSLDHVKNHDIITSKIFNEIFDNYFTSLSFSFNKKIDIEKLIDSLESKNKKVNYNPSNLTRCSIELDGLDTELIITDYSLDIFFTYSSTPIKLVEYFQNARLHLLLNKINFPQLT